MLLSVNCSSWAVKLSDWPARRISIEFFFGLGRLPITEVCDFYTNLILRLTIDPLVLLAELPPGQFGPRELISFREAVKWNDGEALPVGCLIFEGLILNTGDLAAFN